MLNSMNSTNELDELDSIIGDERRNLLKQVWDIIPCDLSFDELFEHYERCGFLYPDKKKRISPYLPLIKRNWELALDGGNEIIWTNNYQNKITKNMASVSVLRTTGNAWMTQHLTADRFFPIGVCESMLRVQAEAYSKKYGSGQTWFRPENKFSNRIFGTIRDSIGDKYATTNQLSYLEVEYDNIKQPVDGIKLKSVKEKSLDLYELIKNRRGDLYAKAEELGSDDIELKSLNAIYRKAGLSRKRHVWMAYSTARDEPVAALIAYRGPFGINFSLLENRCDLIVDKKATDAEIFSGCLALLKKAADSYFNSQTPLEYPVKSLYVLTDEKTSDVLVGYNMARFVRRYSQSIWMNKGFLDWIKHVQQSFDFVYEREKKKLMKSGAALPKLKSRNGRTISV